MKVFIAGASGAIGQPLIKRLTAAGHQVVGMTRSNTDAVRATGAEPVQADAFDAAAVRAAVKGAQPDVVVNELTDLARPLNPRKYDEWLAGTNRLRREGTRNLADAAVAVGAAQFVSQSIAFAYAFDPGVKTEESALIGAVGGDMGAALEELERLTLAAPGGTVLRYGFFYGPGTGYARDGQQIAMIEKRQMPIIGDGSGAYPFIHVEDAAAATVAAIERRAAGIYNVVDDEPAEAREWVPFVADLVGARKPRRIPKFVARIAAGRMAAFATQLQPVSNAKAKRDLGWQPQYASWREGFKAELG